jgi:hypothetical protein
MKTSESIKEIANSLVAFQSELKQPKKDKENPFFKSSYVDLAGVVEAIKPICEKHGLAYTQSIVSSEKGVGVQTMIIHKSGEYILHEPFYFPLQQQSPQGGASASTYARRYSLSAAFGIVPEDDDDGNFASNKQPKEPVEF